MATLNIKLDDGRSLTVNAPDGSTPEELQEMAQLAAEQATAQETPQQQPSSQPSVGQQALALARKPQELAQRGLGEIAGVLPETGQTPSTALNVAIGAPRSAVETLQQVAPEFISPEAVALGAAGKAVQVGAKVAAPLIKGTGRLAAKGVEKFLGIDADSVAKVFAKPISLFTAPTKAKVSAAYSKAEIQAFDKTLEGVVEAGTASQGMLVKQAGKALLNGEQNAQKLLRGRKAIDKQVAQLNSQIEAAKGKGVGALQDAKNAKLALRAEFNKALDTLAPKLREADKLATQQLSVDPFRRLTLPGNVSFTSPAGIARGVPFLPFAAGGAIGGAGAIAGQIGSALKSLPKAAQTSPALLKAIDDLLRQHRGG